MNSFKLLGFRRKLEVFSVVEGFFKLHPPCRGAGSRATEGEKDKNNTEKNDFLANWKSLNEFNAKTIVWLVEVG